jgi:arsenical pump membrane protein
MVAVAIPPFAIWGIAAAVSAGIIARPFHWPEFIWSVAGAVMLVSLGLISYSDALIGVEKGADVYLFLIGMMLLAELARHEGLFDWLAANAVRMAKGSAKRLFTMIFAVGTVVTIFLSNDATAVVLTPAVAAVVETAQADDPMPFVFICAFIANAASFVLPISNPANLVIYGSHMPPLLKWLPRYGLPSIISICVTYFVLRWTQRAPLKQSVLCRIEVAPLSAGGKMAAWGIVGTALVLLASSACDLQLGPPTFLAGVATTFIVVICSETHPTDLITNMSWDVLLLVAGLFVLVEALEKTGSANELASLLHQAVHRSATLTAWASGTVLAVACNLVNNLPAGLLAGRVAEIAKVSERVRVAVLLGIDLGPNLSVTGSLATILWLTALKRSGRNVSAWRFLKLGALLMPAALLLAIASALAFG